MSKTREVILGDWLDNDIEDKSIDVLMCDPPYYNVKGDFDFIWDSFEEYLKDVEKWAVECKRILKDNGSLFWWGHAKKIAYAQIIFDKYFNLGNSLVWEKKECQTKAQDYGQARYFAPITERCLFYSNEIEMSGREFIEKEYIAPRNPYSREISKGMKRYNLREIDFRKLRPSKNGNLTGWCSNIILGTSNPTKQDWDLIESIIKSGAEYESLRAEYESLRAEYESLRRPFNNHYKHNDVIKHSQQSNISRLYDHDTIKPVSLVTQLLEVTTRKDSKVLIPFGGSGTDVEACIDLGLNYTCYEIDPKHYETIKAREKKFLGRGLPLVEEYS
ncbi:MAG: DNA methyltransferase [Candidatus Woesearchaeota archaeon]|jgi:site-specific DNA-methyltransferase (adenine-specific)|nr:DNA methyltransferase [Candidatus Woesearchaeota archaeon]